MKKIFFLFLININFIIFSEIKFLGDLFDVRLKDTEKKRNQEFLKHFNFIREIPWQDMPKCKILINGNSRSNFLVRFDNYHHFAATTDKWFIIENNEDLANLLKNESSCWAIHFFVHKKCETTLIFEEIKKTPCDDCIIL